MHNDKRNEKKEIKKKLKRWMPLSVLSNPFNFLPVQ